METMFQRILCANDGSERAARALALATTMAKENNSELHMVSVEEIDYMPEFIEEIREETGTAARRFHKAVQHARATAENNGVNLRVHLLAGHAVRDIVRLAAELKTDLLVIGSAGHSQFYGRMLGSRADKLVHLAPCPVLVVR
jgi:nucleotide-binding universal stress UspA family protein